MSLDSMKCLGPQGRIGYGFPSSRDWTWELKCDVSNCPYNDKCGCCSCPSSIKIVNGKCYLYEKCKESNSK
jgi:hypothetical protein